MSKKRKVYRDGQFVEVEPRDNWQPPQELRSLPEDYYTRDTSDPDRIHELDAPHIREALTNDRLKAETAEESSSPDEIVRKYDLEDGPLDQLHIDLLRFKIIRNLITSAAQHAEANLDFSLDVRHLWFPQERLSPRKLRDGNPPADQDRPKHLKGLKLAVDPYSWPERVVDMLAAKGIELPNVRLLELQMKSTIQQAGGIIHV